MKAEKLICGMGFYYKSSVKDDLPVYTDLCKMVEERAFYLHLEDKSRSAIDNWLMAENELFGKSPLLDGYKIFVCDLDNKENDGFKRYFDIKIITKEIAS